MNATRLEGVALVAARALANEATGLVAADGSRRAGRLGGGAFVDVDAAAVRAAGEAGSAHALGDVVDQHALLVGQTS